MDGFALDCWNDLDARARKAAADDLLVLGRADLLHRTDAPLDALTWLRAVDLSSRGQHSEAVRLALRLPRDRYRGKLALFAAAIGDADDQWAEVEGLLSSWAERQPGICALVAKVLLAGGGTAVSANGDRRLNDAEMREIIEVAGDWPSPVKAVGALLGASVELGPDDLDRLDTDLLDDVIDAGIVAGLTAHKMRTDNRAYALARLDPGMLNDEQCAALDLPAARARLILRRMRQSDAGGRANELAGLDHAELWQRSLEQSNDSLSAVAELFSLYDDPRASDLTALATDGGLPSELLLQDPDLETFLFERREHLGDPAKLSTTGQLRAQRRFVARLLLGEGLAAVLQWDWVRCEDLARKVLASKADDNGIRAEANALIGVVRWMEDDPEAAAKAFAVAASGATSPAPHINAAIAQQAVDERKAVALWERVAALPDAPLEVRSASLLAAIDCWFSQASENAAPPESLRSRTRELAKLAIDRDHLRAILEFLAVFDTVWLAKPESMSNAKHAKSPEVKIFTATAQGFEAELSALASVLRSGSAASWVERKRDRWVDEALNGLMVDEPEAQYVHGGVAILDARMPMPRLQRMLLRAAVARGVALHIDPADGEPLPRYLEWIEQDRSKRVLRDVEASDQREWVEKTQEAAARALAACHIGFRYRQLQDFAQLHDNVVDALQTTPSWRLDLGAVRDAGRSIVGFCNETLDLVRRLRAIVGAEFLEPMDELERHCRDLSASADKFT